MSVGYSLAYIAAISAALAIGVLFSPAANAISATVLLASIIICIAGAQVFMLGLFSMLAALRYQPITTKQAFVTGVLSLIAFIAAFGCIFRYFGIIDGSSSVLNHDPFDCLYFSIVTWTALGYGDFRPSPPVRLVAAAEALIGYVSMVGLLGIAGQYLIAQSISREKIDEFNKELERWERRSRKRRRKS